MWKHYPRRPWSVAPSCAVAHVGVGDRYLIVKQSIDGLQFLIVVDRPDHGHNVVARTIFPIQDGPRCLVHGDGVYSWEVAQRVDAVDRRHRGRYGGRLKKETVANAGGGDGSLDANHFSKG